MDEKKREEKNQDRQVSPSRAQAAQRESLTERVSYAWGRWLAVPSNPEDEYVLA